MSASVALRHARHLSAAAATTSSTSSGISISKVKTKLRSEFDPDKALHIYSSISNHYTSSVPRDITIKRLAKSRRFADIESLLEAHKSDCKSIQEPYLSTLIRSYGVAGMFDHALKTYNQMDELGTPRSAISFNALLSACNQSKLFDQVPKLFEEIPQKHGFSPDKVSYGILVKSLCALHSPELAIATLKEMEEKGIEITTITYTTILCCLYKKGNSEEAERTWNEMLTKRCPLDVAAYNVRLMNAHGGDPENVKTLLGQMRNAGLKPDAISYNYLLTCYCKCGMMEEAIKVYQRLGENGCGPNAATFRTLIFHLCGSGDFEKAHKLFKESVRVHKIPDFNTLKHLVQGLVKISKIEEAKGMCSTAKKKFPANFLISWRKLEEELGLAAAHSGPSEEKEAQEASG